MATEDARYRLSSQYRLWSFSRSQLDDLRSKTNALAKASIAERLSTRNASTPGSGANTPQPDAENQLPEFLTPAEELQLLDHYTLELLRAAAFLKAGTDVTATAAAFFRRFYVTNSIMTYPPTEIMKTCLFFGFKVEGNFNVMHYFTEKFPNTTREHILAGEYLLCQAIRFSFDVKHPFRALEGAIVQLRQYGDIEERRLETAHVDARAILKFSSLATDVYFHYTPSQIMFAALSLADNELFERIIHETFKPNRSQEDNGNNKAPSIVNGASSSKKGSVVDKEQIIGAEIRDKVIGTIRACRDMLSTAPPENKPEPSNIIKPLNKKLRKCRDPDRWDLVALQQTKKEGSTVKGLAEKNGLLDEDGAVFGSDTDGRDAKRRKVSKAPADPFGPALKG